MVKKFKANGAEIKRLREGLERQSLQKEFAESVNMSIRKYRNIENANANLSADEADRIARKLFVKREAILYATDQPRLVPPSPASSLPDTAKIEPEFTIVPRYDDLYLRVTKDAGDLFDDAVKSHLVFVHILTALTTETAAYAEDMVKLLQSLSFAQRDRFSKVDAGEELSIRTQLQKLLVMLRGNDVWIYCDHHTKYLPESYEPRDHLGPDYEWQTILAFGAPGEYGDDTVKVTVDNGQPWNIPTHITPIWSA
ncbi:MAG: helix-turn-helix transcriptional regulator [Rhizomicrobium sp.]|nr:helix-turn-helix transcriptional regulator [Rhizomicrobium sp.]